MSMTASERAALGTILSNLGIVALKLGGQNLAAAEGRLESADASRQPHGSPDVRLAAWRLSGFDRKHNARRPRGAT